MEGYIKIIIEENKPPSVEAQLVNNNLWLTVNEMARLLGCFVQTINANLRSIFKKNLLSERDCMYCNRYIDKGIEKQTEYYNLEVLICLSYRIATFEAKIFRQFVHSSFREHLQQKEIPEVKLSWLYLPSQNYRLN